jgi:peptide chain release factor 1
VENYIEKMLPKLKELESKFERIQQQLQEPGVTGDKNKYHGLMKEYAGLKEIVESYRTYKIKTEELADAIAITNEGDAQLKAMAKEEKVSIEADMRVLEEKLQLLLLPKDPNDDKNIILEIRAGAGGDEASLFAEQLYRSYTLYAAKRGWVVRGLSMSQGNVGGYKEVIATISGENVYSSLKYESGVHRVQRVPKTEASGRVHTSTVTVVVIPEAEEIDVKINMNEVRVDVFRSSGNGGQSVNTTDSAVRVTHLPTGLVVSCQDGKSQLSNKEQAFKVLYSRLLKIEQDKAVAEASAQRLDQIGTGDRSERIRTYNFPQSRVTDHRINLTIHQINELMNGGMELMIDPLVSYQQAEALKAQAAT